MALQIIVFIALCVSFSSAQWQQQLQGGGRTCGNCACPDEYIPFCGSDGRTETTYRNRCQLECAQKCNSGLRVKFEGVCAEPYRERGSKTLGGNSASSWGSSYQTTRRPYISTYPVQTTRRPYQVQTTRNPYSSNYAVPTTTRRPYSSNYNAFTSSTRRPFSSSGFGPVVQPPNQYYGSSSNRIATAVPYTIPTTTNQPWWQSQRSNPSTAWGSGNSGWRRNRGVYDDDDDV